MTHLRPGKFVDPARVIHTLGLSEGSSFADFGSGSGAYILAAAPLVGASGRIYAVDIQKDLLLKLKQQVTDADYTNVKFLWCDFENYGATKIQDESLDVVLISNTLFQLDDTLGALKEAFRVLKSNGTLFIIDWSESFKGMGPEKEKVIMKEDALELAHNARFTLKEEFNPGEHHYGLSLTKI
jgi:ubiquinone/menaquinone biosynthesis C-methylase UbiE